jgi:arsenate reductase
MIYYHNPRCSKSRQGLALLEENNVTPTVKEYLKEGLEAKELELKGKDLSRNEWIKVITENPVLLERPILDTGVKAAVGRPPEDLLQVL